MGYKIFLSHNVADAGSVKWIADSCKAVGIEAYLYEHDPRPGELVADKLQTAIRNSDAVIVLLTANSQSSPYVQQEIGFAKGQGKPVIPLVQPGVDNRALAMLQGLEYIPFDAHDPEPGLAKLLAYLQKAKLSMEANQALFAFGAIVETATRAKLSRWEIEILRNVPEDGRIMRLDFQLGESLLVGPVALPDLNNYDAGSAAHYLDALESLQRRELVRFAGGDLYTLTGRGFDARSRILEAASSS